VRGLNGGLELLASLVDLGVLWVCARLKGGLSDAVCSPL
jgi:hypothetical protein